MSRKSLDGAVIALDSQQASCHGCSAVALLLPH
jgi:hypothetical protein